VRAKQARASSSFVPLTPLPFAVACGSHSTMRAAQAVIALSALCSVVGAAAGSARA
jgi:hypothetical protein